MTKTDYDSWGKPFPPKLNPFAGRGHCPLRVRLGLRGADGGVWPAGVELLMHGSPRHPSLCHGLRS